MQNYDAIVVGTGGVGSAALFHLARRGVRVLGLDPFPVAHRRGSSHGQTRIIRQAYFEHCDYVPLLLRAYELWNDLEKQSGKKLFHNVGLVEVGPSDGVVIPGVRLAAREHSLPLETLTVPECHKRFPEFKIPSDLDIVFEPTAGYLLVENSVATHMQLAIEAGAEWRQEAVAEWNLLPGTEGVAVRTAQNEYQAGRLVITAGAWSQPILKKLGLPLQVMGKHQYWFEQKPGFRTGKHSPAFFFEVMDGYYYGFPNVDGRGIKIARHSGGSPWEQPRDLDLAVDDEDLGLVREFCTRHLFHTNATLLEQQACMYTLSIDEHFIVDQHPESCQVAFAAGLSGHGFKFTSVLGEVLAGLTLDGESQQPIDFLSASRFKRISR